MKNPMTGLIFPLAVHVERTLTSLQISFREKILQTLKIVLMSEVLISFLSFITNIDENVSILEIFVPEQNIEFSSILIVIYNS